MNRPREYLTSEGGLSEPLVDARFERVFGRAWPPEGGEAPVLEWQLGEFLAGLDDRIAAAGGKT